MVGAGIGPKRQSLMLDAETTNHGLIASATNPANDEAWRNLHQVYHAALIRHCVRSGLNDGEAEDVAALTLATLAMRLSRSGFKWQVASLRGWLSETANRLIFDVHLRRKRERLSEDAIRLMQEWLPPAFAPEHEVEAREQMERHLWTVCLARVRADVPIQHWQIFEAHALLGRKSNEVAELFGTSSMNVRVIRSRLVLRIKKEWKSIANQQIDIPE